MEEEASAKPSRERAVPHWHAYEGSDTADHLKRLKETFRCSVCLSEFSDGRRVSLLPCMHSDFCETCALRWITTVFCTCPICKTSVTTVIRRSHSSDSSSSADGEKDTGARDDGEGLEAFECDAEVLEGARVSRVEQQAEGAPDLSCLDATFFAEELRKLSGAAMAAEAELRAEMVPMCAVRRVEEIMTTAAFLSMFMERSQAAARVILEEGAVLAQSIAGMAEELEQIRSSRGCRASTRMMKLEALERKRDEEAVASMAPEDSEYCYKVTHPPQPTLLDAFLTSPKKKQKQKRKRKAKRKQNAWQEPVEDLDNVDDDSYEI